jgi:hypothetical protein
LDRFLRLAALLQEDKARFVVIGVWGANYYAKSASTLFTTQDRDLFLPSEPGNLLLVWQSCRLAGLALSTGDEPLGEPIDDFLAERVVERRALTQATDGRGLDVDLTLVMEGFGFEEVWNDRRLFRVEDVEIPVARLSHIVASKSKANRPKDRLFLETHAEALRRLIEGS